MNSTTEPQPPPTTTRATVPDHEWYSEYRLELHSSSERASATFDKWMLTLSGGALGLSLTFATNVVSPGPAAWPSSLLGAWGCFTVTLMMHLLSLRISHSEQDAFIQVLDDEASQGPDGLRERVRQVQAARPWSQWIEWLQWASMGWLALGLILLGLFIYANITPLEIANGK